MTDCLPSMASPAAVRLAAARELDSALAHPEHGALSAAVRYLPAGHHPHMGGDVYEILSRGSETLLLVADVRGKGAAASGLARVLLELFRAVVTYGRGDLASVALALDEAVVRAGGAEDFATAVLVRIDDDGGVQSVNCGHPQPLIVGAADLRPLSTTTCLPLGLGTLPVIETDRLRPGERLFLYTDGLSDARDPAGRFFPVAEQEDVLRSDDLETALDALLGRVVWHARGAPDDDLVLVLAQRPGAGGAR
jgi:serine phosphatase RsbU (regulator of sigma subunit)